LQEFGFEGKYDELVKKMKESDFENDVKHKSKKDLADKYDTSSQNTFRVLMDEKAQHVPVTVLKGKHEMYHQQLEIYGRDAEIEVKPFGLLKIVYDDGNELIPGLFETQLGQIDAFNLVSTDKQIVVDFRNGFDKCLEEVTAFYDALTKDQMMEGVVIKPNFYVPNVAPYMKVRNPNYLTIIYGYDYTTDNKYTKLMKQKSINKKVKMSIEEFNLGLKMLATKWSDITPENAEYSKLLVQFLFLEENEKDIDPRL
jgi:hypothetical protein